MTARIASLRMPDLIGPTIQSRASNEAMLFRTQRIAQMPTLTRLAYKVFAVSEDCVPVTVTIPV